MGLGRSPLSIVFYNVFPVMRIPISGLSYTVKAKPSKKARISTRSDFRCHLDLEHLVLITMPQTWYLYKGRGRYSDGGWLNSYKRRAPRAVRKVWADDETICVNSVCNLPTRLTPKDSGSAISSLQPQWIFC